MGTKVLIVDVGNSKTKCYIFDIDSSRKYYQTVDCIHEETRRTPRGHAWDLIDTCRVMMFNAICEYSPDAGMVTAFGDAFVLKSKRRFVHADEPAPALIEYPYFIDGWPRDIQLTGIRALKAKHQCEWKDMYSINGWVTSQLCHKEADDPWHAWDITQASISGCYNLQTQKWIDEKERSRKKRFDAVYLKAPNIIPSSKKVGNFEGVPILAGGLDNAFIDTTNPDPYIVAGTWLVIGTVAETDNKGKILRSEWTGKRREAGVRWLISGNGNYHKQIVKKVSNPITEEEMRQILTDLETLGVQPSYSEAQYLNIKGAFTPARVRVLGGYGDILAEDLTERTNKFHFYTPGQTPHRPDLYQHEQSAQFVYNCLYRR